MLYSIDETAKLAVNAPTIKKRHPKEINRQADIDEIVNISYENACKRSTIMSWFADFGEGPRFNTYDTIIIPKDKYGLKKKNKKPFKTTVGIWLFNKSCIEPMSDVLGYVNTTMTKKAYKSLNQTISYAILENKITTRQLKTFICQCQLIMGCTSALCPSHTMDLLLLTNKAEVKKKQLEKENAEGLAKNDLVAMKKVEDGLIDWAKEELKDSEAVDMFNSGARSDWGNNFKNMYLIKGPIKQTDGSYNFVDCSYMSGMEKKDLSKVNDAAVEGPYARSNKTREGGYKEKLFTYATQHVKVLGPGTDCKSKHYITVTLTNGNIGEWMYCFVIGNNGSLTEITSENKDKFIGKTVKMRFSGLCEAKGGICEKCAGTLYNRIGIQNIGLGSMIMMSSLKNGAMKAFHDSTLSLAKIDPNEAFGLK